MPAGLSAAARDDVDDAAVTLLSHDRDRGPHAVDAAVEVHGDHLLELAGREIFDRRSVPHAGVVEQHVDPTGAFHCEVDDRADSGVVADVGHRGVYALLGERGEPRLVDVASHHLGAVGAEPLGERAPDATRRAGDHDRATLETLHDCPLLRRSVLQSMARLR